MLWTILLHSQTPCCAYLDLTWSSPSPHLARLTAGFPSLLLPPSLPCLAVQLYPLARPSLAAAGAVAVVSWDATAADATAVPSPCRVSLPAAASPAVKVVAVIEHVPRKVLLLLPRRLMVPAPPAPSPEPLISVMTPLCRKSLHEHDGSESPDEESDDDRSE